MSNGGASGGARVRATTVRVREHFVMARYGRTSREAYRRAASQALRSTLETPGDRWVEFAQFIEATELACKLFAGGDPTLAREIGAFGAETNVGVWRSLVHRVLSPATVLGIASGLWSHHYDGGRLVVGKSGASGVRLRVEAFPEPHRLHCLSIEGWCKRTIELGRPKRVSVSDVQCRLRGDDACELMADWE